MERLGDIEYSYESDASGFTVDKSRQLFWKGQDIRDVLRLHIRKSKPVPLIDPYDKLSKRINFNPIIRSICNDVFPIFPEIRKKIFLLLPPWQAICSSSLLSIGLPFCIMDRIFWVSVFGNMSWRLPKSGRN